MSEKQENEAADVENDQQPELADEQLDETAGGGKAIAITSIKIEHEGFE